jgi:hypothetical protein
MYCLRVNVCCHRMITQLQLINISISTSVIQHAKRMRVIDVCGMSESTKYFLHYFTNDATFGRGGGRGGGNCEHKTCVFIFSTSLYAVFIILRRNSEMLSQMYTALQISCCLPNISFYVILRQIPDDGR